MIWWTIHFGILVAATVVTAISTPLCRRLARKAAFLDHPLGEHHKQHDDSTPLLGGLAMLIGWIVTVFGGLAAAHLFMHHLDPALTNRLGPELVAQLQGIPKVFGRLGAIAGGAGVLCIMGIIDDKKQLGPFVKVACQIIVCSVVALAPDLRVTMFWEHPMITWGLTVLWYVFIINAFNFFDNMDGLASGMALIASVLFAITAGLQGQYYVAALAAVTAGTALGFYAFNRHPASIFMGDAGSHFLGFLLASIATLTIYHRPEDVSTVAAWLTPLFILALPVFDTFAVIVIRIRNRKPIYYGDHNHISHRFLKMGFDRPTAVLLVHILAFAIGLGALPLLWLPSAPAALVLVQSLVMLLLVSILHQRGATNSD
jgi:UDP-GlcNAc:undecaprenyl-phosphate GlcNAc-1-phosphate transferase